MQLTRDQKEFIEKHITTQYRVTEANIITGIASGKRGLILLTGINCDQPRMPPYKKAYYYNYHRIDAVECLFRSWNGMDEPEPSWNYKREPIASEWNKRKSFIVTHSSLTERQSLYR